jgi:hypothetical protein
MGNDNNNMVLNVIIKERLQIPQGAGVMVKK